ncbi:MAG: calcium/sodium antiporter [bacterium]|nr:calcium/sodium antiporter [bacterium]
MLQQILTIVIALAGVSLGAEILVRGASRLALRAGVSSLFVGLTVVGFGTSSPELGASLTATLRQSSDVALGNVVGSNLFNIGVILGLTALLQPIRVQLSAVRRDLLVAAGAALVPWLALPFGGFIPRPAGFALVALLVVYLATAYRQARQTAAAEALRLDPELRPAPNESRGAVVRDAVMVIAGLALLVIGSRGFVDASIAVARQIGWSELVIGLTLVSVGTSLPELVTALVAVRRGDTDIAVGNVIGSNIFNTLGIAGTCAAVAPQAVNHTLLVRDAPLMLVGSLALFPIIRSGARISRLEGGVLLGVYVAYAAYLIITGG